MKSLVRITASLSLLTAALLFPACTTAKTARHNSFENRQDRIDSRTTARQDRWHERAAREDARAEAGFAAW